MSKFPVRRLASTYDDIESPLCRTPGPVAADNSLADAPMAMLQLSRGKGKQKDNAGTSTRFRWTPRMENDLVDAMYNYKLEQDGECKDMEADLMTFYSEIRRIAAVYQFDMIFGPLDLVTVDSEETQDLQFSRLQAQRENEKKAISSAYAKIKEKVRSSITIPSSINNSAAVIASAQ